MRRRFGRLRGSIFDLGMALWADRLLCRSSKPKKATWLMQSPQESNPDGASAELRRRTAQQQERGEEELYFDVSNP